MSRAPDSFKQERTYTKKCKTFNRYRKLSATTTFTTVSLLGYDLYCELFSSLSQTQLNRQDWIVLLSIAGFLVSHYKFKSSQRSLEKIYNTKDFSLLCSNVKCHLKEIKNKNKIEIFN